MVRVCIIQCMIVFINIAGNDDPIDAAWLCTVLDSSYRAQIDRILPRALLHGSGEWLVTVGQLRSRAGHDIGTTSVSALFAGTSLTDRPCVGAMVRWWTCEIAISHPTAV